MALCVVVSYGSSHLAGTMKVQFYYALNGRGRNKGLVHITDSEFLGKGVLLVPEKHISNVKVFFAKWNCPIKVYKVEVGVANETA